MEKLIGTKYVLSITFGDYKNTLGGVAKAVLTHQYMFNENGISYICIFPLNLSNRRYAKNNKYWGVTVDGFFDNVCSTKMLINFLIHLSHKGVLCECIHIHHLRHIDINELSNILRCMDTKIYFYIHDYYSICASTKLIGDNGFLCRSDFLKNKRCETCRYYSESIKFKGQFERFVLNFWSRIIFIAPSDTCKHWFLKQYTEYAKKVIVVYHQILEGDYVIPKKTDSVIKIGYVGLPIPTKGWNQFKKLYDIYRNNNNYEFIYFSSISDASVDIRHVSVDFQQSLTAMQDVLRKERVDYVLLWSTWPETYSYTYYESYSAGCCVITNPDSGNIADQVKKMNSGFVLTEQQLLDFFSNDSNVNKYRHQYILDKKNVCSTLQENKAIVEVSNKEPCMVNDSYHHVGYEMIPGKILKIAYKVKLKLRKQW